MEAKKWESKIKSMCKKSGIIAADYAPVIQTLASILEKRDSVLAEFEAGGANAVITYTNKGGKSNPVKNPLVVIWDDLNKSALAYWRELGLTPSSYRKLSGEGPSKGKASGLAAALQSLED